MEEGSDQVHPRKTLPVGETFLFSEYGAWALVTGCTRGIGREYALGLARLKSSPLMLNMFKLSTRRGLNVVLVARDKNALEQLALEVKAEGVEAKVVVEDFAKEGAVSRVVDKVPISSIHFSLETFSHPLIVEDLL